MLEFFLASGNLHKVGEFKEFFSKNKANFSVKEAPQKIDVLEDGPTYLENAYLKAKGYHEALKKPVMSDDSGLEVLGLPGELGIYSSRFGGGDLTDFDKVKYLLERLKGLSGEKRDAVFTCVLCFFLNPHEVFFFEGRLRGKISETIVGEKGFGYDPVFIPGEIKEEHFEGYLEGKRGVPDGDITLASVPEWKAEHSHRAKSCYSAVKFFKERVCQSERN
jgi:XTP/dITP diphosphohydrolase